MTTVIGLAVTFIAFGVILYFARKAGKDAVKAAVGKANAKAAERIAKSSEAAPRTKSDVLERLRSRHRKL